MALPGGLSTAEFKFQDLENKYYDFGHPVGLVLLGGEELKFKDDDIVINDIRVEATSGYEASVATFRIFGVYNTQSGEFAFEQVEKQVILGNTVEIKMGYLDQAELVFAGYISGMTFGYDEGDMPYIEVTAMDVKGLMMGGSYAYSISATSYSAAVQEILDRTGSAKMSEALGKPEIEDTPDAKGKDDNSRNSPLSVEMVNESDYEFIVRAAKRYNYEFFVDRGKTYFRPAKKNKNVLMELGVGDGIRTFHIEYSITGVVSNIEARAMDPGKGDVITSSGKFTISVPKASEKANKVLGNGTKVYVDASISSKDDADSRVQSLMEKMSYRLGALDARCVGIPELVPGRFIKIGGFGKPIDNTFYLTKVVHELDSENGYSTYIEGCANAMKSQ